MLDSLQKAINNAVQVAEEWALAHPNSSNKAPFDALIGEHIICKTLLENFRKGSEKYLLSILNGKPKGYRDKMKREWAKMMWYMFHSDDATALQKTLILHVMAINMHSEQLRCQILKNIASSNSSALTVVGRNINEKTVTLKDVLLAMQSVQDSILTSNPSAGLFPQETPLKLFDAIGREFHIPAHLTVPFDIFYGYLELIFKNQRSYAKIVQREYNLAEEDGEGALITVDKWAELIKPGMSISLSMILRRSSAPERACPRCNTQCIGPELAGRRLRWYVHNIHCGQP